ncbi:hypothetical protein E2C01_013312 [Portunus trituberculatus]|uniref:Uncharacterized protein n=1 Tax=Portunus trituberculatus TaxID=210409 RepID=A0A5B7DGB3_PORTR|nr:hypothetical protein [Portunus trituberculatus]
MSVTYLVAATAYISLDLYPPARLSARPPAWDEGARHQNPPHLSLPFHLSDASPTCRVLSQSFVLLPSRLLLHNSHDDSLPSRFAISSHLLPRMQTPHGRHPAFLPPFLPFSQLSCTPPALATAPSTRLPWKETVTGGKGRSHALHRGCVHKNMVSEAAMRGAPASHNQDLRRGCRC